jgi:putative SOS response-associated peptidase YedK
MGNRSNSALHAMAADVLFRPTAFTNGADGKRKVPLWVYLKNREPFAFAGLWDHWRDPAGEKDLYTFAITAAIAVQALRSTFPLQNL